MRTTNITDLRTHLSQILDAVRQGEEVEVRVRDVPVARLVPVSPATEPKKGRIPPWIEKLRREGKVRVGSMKPYPEIVRGFPPGTPVLGTLAIDAVIEERRTGR